MSKNQIYLSKPIFHWPVEADEKAEGIEKSNTLYSWNRSIGMDDDLSEKEGEEDEQPSDEEATTGRRHAEDARHG